MTAPLVRSQAGPAEMRPIRRELFAEMMVVIVPSDWCSRQGGPPQSTDQSRGARRHDEVRPASRRLESQRLARRGERVSRNRSASLYGDRRLDDRARPNRSRRSRGGCRTERDRVAGGGRSSIPKSRRYPEPYSLRVRGPPRPLERPIWGSRRARMRSCEIPSHVRRRVDLFGSRLRQIPSR